jgi:hypothetical protein
MFIVMVMLSSLFGTIGCSPSSDNADSISASKSAYEVTTEPDGSIPIGDARRQAKDDEEVTLVGRIGGSLEPFVEGMAAFTIVDPSVPYCADEEAPWSYCCHQDAVKENIATVQIVDETGNTVMSDARKLFNVKEFSTVTVQGKAKRDQQGNLAVHVTKLFVNAH